MLSKFLANIKTPDEFISIVYLSYDLAQNRIKCLSANEKKKKNRRLSMEKTIDQYT